MDIKWFVAPNVEQKQVDQLAQRNMRWTAAEAAMRWGEIKLTPWLAEYAVAGFEFHPMDASGFVIRFASDAEAQQFVQRVGGSPT